MRIESIIYKKRYVYICVIPIFAYFYLCVCFAISLLLGSRPPHINDVLKKKLKEALILS